MSAVAGSEGFLRPGSSAAGAVAGGYREHGKDLLVETMGPCATCVFAAALCVGAATAGGQQAAASQPETVYLSAADTILALDRAAGGIVSLRVGRRREEMARSRPAGFVEVVDLRDGRTYNPLAARTTITDEQHTGDPQRPTTLSFRQDFDGAAFGIRHRLGPTAAGLRWDVALKLLDGQRDNRSVQVAWVLPLPRGWRFWVPNTTKVHYVDGVTPRRFVYAHAYFREFGTVIPLAGALGRRGALAVFSPPDVQKVQITFDVFTQASPAGARGPVRAFEDTPKLRITHQYVGLRPERELKLSLCFAGVRPSWRAVLGHYARAYPELFEPVPATRKVEGMYGIRGLGRIGEEDVRQMKAAGVTFAELHGSFPEYGEYMTEEALAHPEAEYYCEPHKSGKISLAHNRRWVAELMAAGVAPFMYFYNCHANPETIEKRWPKELMVDERGRPLIKYRTEPALHAQPDSPFGRHLIRQMDLMLRAYPKLPGFFIDNYAIEMIDFGHDDGVTMIHNRPAYDLNRNHQDIGPVCFEAAHKVGKIIMVNKVSTIESLRGADMVLAEGMNIASIHQHGFACIYRPLFPLGMRYGADGAERGLQHLLLVGGTPDEGLYRADPETMKAYRPLTDAMIGKRWLLETEELKLPAPYEGQIFRIDEHAARAGDVVVALVDLSRSWRENRLTEAASLTVCFPGSAEFKQASWLTVENSGDKPQPCRMDREGDEIVVRLPPAGAAGILRLSR